MVSTPPADDRSLLARLNALKQSSVSLERDSGVNADTATPLTPRKNTLGAAVALSSPALVKDQQPVSREDALSARLRSLRNSPAPSSPATAAVPSSSPGLEGSPSPAVAKTNSPVVKLSGNQKRKQQKNRSYEIPSSYLVGSEGADEDDVAAAEAALAEISATQPLEDFIPPVDEAALAELLEGLELEAGLGKQHPACDGPGALQNQGAQALEDEADQEQIEDDWPVLPDFDADARKFKKLLKELQKEGTPASGGAVAAQGTETSKKADGDGDDSDGEETARQAEEILAQARWEVELERRRMLAAREEKGAEADGKPDESGKDEETRSVDPNKERQQKQGDNEGKMPPADDMLSDELSLPTVPSQLVDPAPRAAPEEPDEEDPAENQKYAAFENDITVRLAALKGLGAGINTDAFGLPSAPTFQPEDRTVDPAAEAKKKQKKAGTGFTDDEMKTWCIVCLEDATFRCIGCDDDVYCERCWREMHIGPRAGYDERGHQRVSLRGTGR